MKYIEERKRSEDLGQVSIMIKSIVLTIIMDIVFSFCVCRLL